MMICKLNIEGETFNCWRQSQDKEEVVNHRKVLPMSLDCTGCLPNNRRSRRGYQERLGDWDGLAAEVLRGCGEPVAPGGSAPTVRLLPIGADF